MATPLRSRSIPIPPLEKEGRDLIDRPAESGRRPGSKVLQQLPLVRAANVDHGVRWRKQIGDFHGRSKGTPR